MVTTRTPIASAAVLAGATGVSGTPACCWSRRRLHQRAGTWVINDWCCLPQRYTGVAEWLATHGAAVRWCSDAATQSITVLVAAQGKQTPPNREQQRALRGPAYPAVRGAPSHRTRTLTHTLHMGETFQIRPSGVAARDTIDYQIITFNHFMRSQITSGRRSANICLISTLNCDLLARPRLDLPGRLWNSRE